MPQDESGPGFGHIWRIGTSFLDLLDKRADCHLNYSLTHIRNEVSDVPGKLATVIRFQQP